MSLYDSSFLLIYCGILALVLGACMGSFLNCAAIRTGSGESFLRGRSHCMNCGHELRAPDLIPVLSWVFLRGKCRYCGAKVSGRYPLVEVIFALVCLACLLRFDLTILALRNFIFLSVLFYLTLTDIETMIIPDKCHIILALAWIASAPLLLSGREVLMHVAAGVVFGGGILLVSLLMDRILGRESMGGGDIKLLAVVGLYFGFIGTLFVMILSCIMGLIFNVMRGRRGSEDAEAGSGKEFPFGPWIAIAAAIVLFAGDPLISWYTGLLG